MSTEENQGLAGQDSELSEKVGEGVRPNGEEEPLEEENLASDNEKTEDAEIDSENLTSEIPTLSGDADQIFPMLQNLLLHNEIQRERLMGLIQLYDPTAVNMNPVVNAEEGQIATEADLLAEVQFLEQSVQELEEELENQKKANAELEDEINRLTKNSDFSDPEKHD